MAINDEKLIMGNNEKIRIGVTIKVGKMRVLTKPTLVQKNCFYDRKTQKVYDEKRSFDEIY